MEINNCNVIDIHRNKKRQIEIFAAHDLISFYNPMLIEDLETWQYVEVCKTLVKLLKGELSK